MRRAIALRKLRAAITGTAITILLAGGAPAIEASMPTESVEHTINEAIRILSDEELKQPARLAERRKLLERIIGSRFAIRKWRSEPSRPTGNN